MVNLSDIPSRDMARILKLLQRKEAIDRQIAKIIKQSKQKSSIGALVRKMRLPRSAQPSLREMITGILAKTGEPMTVTEIYEASLKTGYTWQSREPRNALNVKMYTDETFMKVAPGKFVLRKKS